MYGYVQRVGAIIKKSQSDNYPTVSARERQSKRDHLISAYHYKRSFSSADALFV